MKKGKTEGGCLPLFEWARCALPHLEREMRPSNYFTLVEEYLCLCLYGMVLLSVNDVVAQMAHCRCSHVTSRFRRLLLVICSISRNSSPQVHLHVANSLHTLQESCQPLTAVPLRVESSQFWSWNIVMFFLLGFSAGSSVLSREADAWPCPYKARWWVNGGLICCLETTLVWIMWTMR